MPCQESGTFVTQYSNSCNFEATSARPRRCNDKVDRTYPMRRFSRRWLAAAACAGVVAWSAVAGRAENQLAGIHRIYVEPFPTKKGSEKIREDLLGELRRQPSLSIVKSESGADAVLTGDGETWIKGYRSLNPRSGRDISNGQPVYAGFLSVELKDLKGDTLWSHLVTLGPMSENISKELSKQIVKHLAEALK